ncbi:porphobilinogen deaminase 2 [Streptomyces chrestomyceticus JCM 4735]|uniref:Hydroxymethylbilane synthase n=1 Tax=Streptomyces chrestomyceticus JCM 4735 TaxID=1306181 RepID=A0A7U9KS41_9ACTN|nr:hydroxymethylbilane synthase [Streptomyces chrestomyceticus]GCD34409.1 porphobilinogen deaminase 2 [Streptomyces chrestomyceticus JCM 4735]
MSTDFPARELRIGTRTSPMALAQTARVTQLLHQLDPRLRTVAVPVRTEADRWHGELSGVGGKGLFVKALDVRLQSGDIDLALHCLKDVPGDVPLRAGLVVAAHLERADVRDVLVAPEHSAVRHLDDLPPGARVGTASVRRRAQLLRLRPDLRIVPVRGAVGTRLDLLDGRPTTHTDPTHPTDASKPADPTHLDALILASAGLARLNLSHRARQIFEVEELLPAVGAGVLSLECRRDDTAVAALLEQLNHEPTLTEATAERVMLQGLRGHCNSPIAGYCVTGPDGRLSLRGMVFSPDGAAFAQVHLCSDAPHDPAALGAHAATELLSQGARSLIDTGIPL